MASLQINFSDVPDSNIALIPDGNYLVSIGGVEIKESSDKTGHYLQWDLTVADGDYAGTKLTYRCSLKQNALWRLKGDLRSLGIDVSGELKLDFDEDTGLLVEPSLVGELGIVSIYTDEYNKTKRSAVSGFVEADSQPKKTIQAPSTTPGKKPVSGGLKIR